MSMAVAKDLKNDIRLINESTLKECAREHIHQQIIDFIRFTNLKRFVVLFNLSENKTLHSLNL